MSDLEKEFDAFVAEIEDLREMVNEFRPQLRAALQAGSTRPGSEERKCLGAVRQRITNVSGSFAWLYRLLVEPAP
jgi:hypothetical protein